MARLEPDASSRENFGRKLERVAGTDRWVEVVPDGRKVSVQDPTDAPSAARPGYPPVSK